MLLFTFIDIFIVHFTISFLNDRFEIIYPVNKIILDGKSFKVAIEFDLFAL